MREEDQDHQGGEYQPDASFTAEVGGSADAPATLPDQLRPESAGEVAMPVLAATFTTALAFSRLIDNSVVVLENIFRHLEMGETK